MAASFIRLSFATLGDVLGPVGVQIAVRSTVVLTVGHELC